ncbi:MAG: hypothetical protein JNK29_10845 [Anaerolineales bacterium]|nr:hypothetical protein [Anaerolineales bacterium]
MQAKRIAVVAASIVIGIALSAFLIYAYIPLPIAVPVLNIQHIGFGTTPERFAYSNVMLLLVAFTGIAFIWLDYFLGTQFLKS